MVDKREVVIVTVWASLVLVGCASGASDAKERGPVGVRDTVGGPATTGGPQASTAERGARNPLESAGNAQPVRPSDITIVEPAAGIGGMEACAEAELMTERVIPKVWLLIDGSGSMAAPLNGLVGESRWGILRTALLGEPDGVVSALQSSIEFGMMVYDGGLSPPGIHVEGLCPRTLVVEPALDNRGALDGAYPALQTGSSTPTHHALLSLQKLVQAARDAGDTTPSYVVLATDGVPNLCDFHDGLPSTPATEQQAVQTVAGLAAADTKTFAISLAGDDVWLNAHLDELARAGGTGKGAFTVASQDELVATLSEILGDAVSCEIRVRGEIEAGHECDGEVLLDGQVLGCEQADGYRVLDDHQSIELLGGACETLRHQHTATLTATFPCEAVTII